MFQEKLIEAIKTHQCLYNKSLSSYKNKLIKEKPEDACQTRWRSLRDRFLKELTKKSKSGSESSDESLCKWQHMEAMMFLKEHVAPRRTFSNINWNQEETVDSIPESPSPLGAVRETSLFQGFSDTSTETPSSSTATRPKLSTIHEEVSQASARFDVLVGTVENLISTQARERSRNEDFLRDLDSYLSMLPESRQDSLKIKMLEMAFKARED